ncbi:MAG: hypothetical protein ACT4TC_18845 [Myxococcaceae bacterium]
MAKGRVAVLPFKDKRVAASRAQILKRLCRIERCVKPAINGGATAVDAVVTGRGVKKAGKLYLELSIYTSEDDAPTKLKVPVKGKGALSKESILKTVQAIQNANDPLSEDDLSASL